MEQPNLHTNYRSLSNKDYEPHPDKDLAIVIKTGCLQRIANALEVIADTDFKKQNTFLKQMNKYYQSETETANKEVIALRRRISALQGVITKLKSKTL